MKGERAVRGEQYARDFSELREADRLALVAAMVRIGIKASEKERSANLRGCRPLPEDTGRE